jgi:ribonuclease VapC
MNPVVLDSSALLALLNGEPGAENLTTDLLATAVCSSVNIAEAHSKLILRGMNKGDAWEAVRYALASIVEFTTEHAQISGDLVIQTRALGLSLGDRACLALGLQLQAPVYTTDRSWKRLNLSVPIHVIR